MKKIINYFAHDYNARDDFKLKKLRNKQGLKGIGLYWCIIELLYENDGYLKLEDIGFLSEELKIDKDSIIDLLNNYELFEKNKQKFYSKRVLKSIENINNKSKKNRENALKRWQNKNANALRGRIANNLQSQCYIKENKKKENKKNKKENKLLTTTKELNIYEYCETNFGRTLSPIEIEKLEEYKNQFNDEIVKYAIDICVQANVKTLNYLNGILKNWAGKGFKCLKEIQEDNLKIKKLKKKEETISDQKKELFDYDWIHDESI